MKKMTTSRFLALAAFFTLMGSGALVSSTKAQGFTVTITVDENGNSTFSNSSGFNSALPSAMLADPGPGGAASALTYGLLNPPGLISGDLLINDADNSLSDVIRFNADEIIDSTTGALVFYSKPGEGSSADVGFPSAFYDNNLPVPEGLGDITIYTPVDGQPGFVTGAGGPVTYIIQSNEGSSVPDTASCANLLALGFSGILGFRRYLKK